MQNRMFVSRPSRLFFTVLAAALLPATGQSSSAQQAPGKIAVAPSQSVTLTTKSVPSLATSGAEKEQEGAGTDASNVGIKMHGHWIIDVKNPDGTLADHRDFQNSIAPSGEQTLIQLMTGTLVSSDFGILLFPSSGSQPGPCAYTSPTLGGTYQGCFIAHSLTNAPGGFYCTFYYCVTGLTVTASLGANPPTLTLSGNVTATQNGSISAVSTYIGVCPPASQGVSGAAVTTMSPSTCSATASSDSRSGPSLTAAYPATINVVANQIIQVTITLSFS